MTQFTKLAWVLTGLIVLTSGACSSNVTPTPPGVTEDVSLSSIALPPVPIICETTSLMRLV